jgi:hypothetical protein
MGLASCLRHLGSLPHTGPMWGGRGSKCRDLNENSGPRVDRAYEALEKQYDSLDEWARSLAKTAERFLYFLGLVAAGALKLGVIDNHPIVVIFSYYAMAIATCYQLQLYTDIEAYLTQRAVVEAQMNTLLKQELYTQSRLIGKKYRGRVSVLMVGILSAGPLVGLGGDSIYQTARLGPHNWHVLNIVGVIVAAVMVLRATWENSFIHKKVLRAARDLPMQSCTR